MWRLRVQTLRSGPSHKEERPAFRPGVRMAVKTAGAVLAKAQKPAESENTTVDPAIDEPFLDDEKFG